MSKNDGKATKRRVPAPPAPLAGDRHEGAGGSVDPEALPSVGDCDKRRAGDDDDMRPEAVIPGLEDHDPSSRAAAWRPTGPASADPRAGSGDPGVPHRAVDCFVASAPRNDDGGKESRSTRLGVTRVRRVIRLVKPWATPILVLGLLVGGLVVVGEVVAALSAPAELLAAWGQGVLGGIAVGAHDALAQRSGFFMHGPSGRDVLAAQAQNWWPPGPWRDIAGYPMPDPDPIAEAEAEAQFDRGVAEGIGLWIWAMSDAAVRTVTGAFCGVAFGILVKKVLDVV